MDLDALEQLIRSSTMMSIDRFLVVATLGTTMLGASDDLSAIHQVFERCQIPRSHVHLHADCALSGGFWHLDPQTPKYQLGKVGRQHDSFFLGRGGGGGGG